MNKRIGLRFLYLLVLVALLLPGCGSAAQTVTVPIVQNSPTVTVAPTDNTAPTSIPKNPKPAAVIKQAEPTAVVLSPDDWQQWPVMPVSVSDALRKIYQQGIDQGNNPHAFSVLGDCQSQPEVFMGIYDTDPAFVKRLTPALQRTVAQFTGSFTRYQPTVKDGTTEGALLWAQWNDNKEHKCEPNETPIDCELRVTRPSIVFIHIGTHWEARNRGYLSTLIDKILEAKAVPVLVTKADNRELDARVNHNLASLADEYNLPLWNFWASVQHLPENGMKHGSDMYLSQEGLEIHRQGALEVLDFVWRSVR